MTGSRALSLAVGLRRLYMVHPLFRHIKKVDTPQEMLMMMSQPRDSILEAAIGDDAIPILEYFLGELDKFWLIMTLTTDLVIQQEAVRSERHRLQTASEVFSCS